MNFTFPTQPLAWPDFDFFTTNTTAVQQAAIFAKALDQGFERQIQLDPRLNPAVRAASFFPKEAAQYLAGPVQPDGSFKLSMNSLAVYQLNNHESSSMDNYQKMLMKSGGVGQGKGLYIAQVIRAALAIASRASEAQLNQQGISAGKNPGVLKTAFPTKTIDPNAGRVIGALGKFMEPTLLRETLLEYRAGAFDSTLRDTEIGEMLMDGLSAGNNIAQEVTAVLNLDQARGLHKYRAAEKIRFQRSMPVYSNLGSTTQHVIRKVAKQQTMYGKMKARPSGRFLFDN